MKNSKLAMYAMTIVMLTVALLLTFLLPKNQSGKILPKGYITDELWDSENRCFNQDALRDFVISIGVDGLYVDGYDNNVHPDPSLTRVTSEFPSCSDRVQIGGYFWNVVQVNLVSGDAVATMLLAEDQPHLLEYRDFVLGLGGDIADEGYWRGFSGTLEQDASGILTRTDSSMYPISSERAFALNRNVLIEPNCSRWFQDYPQSYYIHPLALFTVGGLGFTNYVITPKQMNEFFPDGKINGRKMWYEDLQWNVVHYSDQGVDYGTMLDYWGDDYLWTPSVDELSVWSSHYSLDGSHPLFTRSFDCDYDYSDDLPIDATVSPQGFLEGRVVSPQLEFGENDLAIVRPAFYFNLSKAVYAGDNEMVGDILGDDRAANLQKLADMLANKENSTPEDLPETTVADDNLMYRDGGGLNAAAIRAMGKTNAGLGVPNYLKFDGTVCDNDGYSWSTHFEGNDIYLKIGPTTWTVVNWQIDGSPYACLTLWMCYDEFYSWYNKAVNFTQTDKFLVLKNWGDPSGSYENSDIRQLCLQSFSEADSGLLQKMVYYFLCEYQSADYLINYLYPINEVNWQNGSGITQTGRDGMDDTLYGDVYGDDYLFIPGAAEVDYFESADGEPYQGGLWQPSASQRGASWLRSTDGAQAYYLNNNGNACMAFEGDQLPLRPAMHLNLSSWWEMASVNPQNITIKLDNQGGIGQTSVAAKTHYPLPDVTVPTKTGSVFLGYYENQNGGGRQYYLANGRPALKSCPDIASGTTIYAYWAVDFGAGSGTAADPYLIPNYEKLKLLSTMTNANMFGDKFYYFKQTADIVVPEEWIPIGIEHKFYGSYDGQNFSISGINLTEKVANQGLFGRARDSIIQNVVLKESKINAGTASYIGGILGQGEYTKLINCQNYASVVGGVNVGGIVGGSTGRNQDLASDCVNNGQIQGTSNVGGIAGSATASTNEPLNIKNCINNGTILGQGYMGGIVGVATLMSGVLQNCMNTEAVRTSSNADGLKIGGIAGVVQEYSKITKCINFGDLTGRGYVGGIVGYAKSSKQSEISENISSSRIEVNPTKNELRYGSGGIVGFAIGEVLTVSACAVYGQIGLSLEGADVGLIVGALQLLSKSTVNDCSFVGISSTNIQNGFVGRAAGNSTVTNSYYVSTNTNKKVYTSGTFADFHIVLGLNNGYPMQKQLFHASAGAGSDQKALQFFKDSSNGFTLV